MATPVRHHDRLVAMHGKLVKFPDNCFTFNVDPTKGNGFNSFQLPITSNSTTNCYVDFGDGTGWIHITSYNQADTLHNYPDNSIRTIKIKGEVSWSFNNAGDCQKLTYISKWGSTKFNYVAYGFYGCINLTYIPQIGGIYAPTVTSINRLFYGCVNLNCPIPPDLLKHCVNITTADALFLNCVKVYGGIPSTLLKHCTLLTSIVDLLRNCQSLIGSVPDDLLRYNINLIDVGFMMYGCLGITSFTGELFKYNINLESAYGVFFNCSGLDCEIPADLFTTTINITTLVAFFQGCVKLRGAIPVDLLRYTVKVKFINQMFYNCNGLTSFDSTLLIYMPLLTNVRYLFYSCNALNIDNFFIPLSVIPNITDFSYMMYNTTPSERFTGTVQDIWNYASPTANKLNCFTGQDLLTNYNDIPNEWKGL